MRFDLPDLLQAERAGRCLALRAPTGCVVAVSPCLQGAAGLVAARHVANLGAQARVILESQIAEGCDVFTAMLEVVGTMNLPLAQQGTGGNDSDFGHFIDATDTPGVPLPGVLNARDFLAPNHPEIWDGYSLTPRSRPSPFISPGTIETAKTVAAVRSMDARATEDYSLPGLCLMENAGIGATVAAVTMPHANDEGPVVVLAGGGNNGGDAFVVARGLLERALPVRVLLLGDPKDLPPDALCNYEILGQAENIFAPAPTNPQDWSTVLNPARLVVDGLFGTGLDRAVGGAYAMAIEAINASRCPVLALDIPSGLHGDTGEVLGTAVRADRTVTFAAPKHGLFQGEGPDRCGEILTASIGCPAELLLP